MKNRRESNESTQEKIELFLMEVKYNDGALLRSDFDLSKSEFTVHNLIYTSEFFLNKAHLMVLDTSDDVGMKNYYKMIKLSIKALLILIKKYGQFLNPHLELIIYFRLAKLFLNETNNLDRADDYVNKAISISSRNNLVKLKFATEFLAGKILDKTNPKLLPNYLNEKIKTYQSSGYNDLASLLILFKINSLLISDYRTGLIVLQTLTSNSTISIISTIACLFEASLHLYRGSPKNCQTSLSKVEDQVIKEFPQLIAMKLLLQFQFYNQTNDVTNCRNAYEQIGDFISRQRENQWSSWNEDGSFVLESSIGDDLIPFQIFWLNSDEFVIVFYFLTGVHFLFELQHPKKADKVFNVCLGLINSQLEELTKIKASKRKFPVSQLTNKIIRLNYTKIYIQYYQVWLLFMKNDFSSIGPLQAFLDNYNANNFTDEELCYYKLLIPKIYYLFGIYNQFHGDLNTAKRYYFLVRQCTSRKSKTSLIASSLQFLSGIGGETFQAENEYSELFVFSTLHLLVITNYHLQILSSTPNNKQGFDHNTQVSENYNFISSLYQDLDEGFNTERKLSSNTFTMNFTMSNKFLVLTHQAMQLIYASDDNVVRGGESKILESLHMQIKKAFDELEIPKGMRFVKTFILYVLYLGSISLEEKKKFFSFCMELIKDATTDNEKILSLLILRDSNLINMENNDQDKLKMTNLQIQMLKQQVADKFQNTPELTS